MDYKNLSNGAIELLKLLISTQSFSGEEGTVADLMNHYLTSRGIKMPSTLGCVFGTGVTFWYDKISLIFATLIP